MKEKHISINDEKYTQNVEMEEKKKKKKMKKNTNAIIKQWIELMIVFPLCLLFLSSHCISI